MVKPQPKICANFHCAKQRKREDVMCEECWSHVPPDVQQLVSETHEQNQSVLRYSTDYANAVMKAIRSLHGYRREQFKKKNLAKT